MSDSELTEHQRAILDFERQWWKYAGSKDREIDRQFGITLMDFYRELNTIIDLPGATEHDPTLVRRLQRARTLRRRRATRSLRLVPAQG